MGASGARKCAPEMLPGAPAAGTRGARVTRPSVTGRAMVGPPHCDAMCGLCATCPEGPLRGAAAAPNSRKLYDREQAAQAVNELNSSHELRR